MEQARPRLTERMQIVDLGGQPAEIRHQAVALLHETFNHAFGWPSLDSARRELDHILETGFALALVEKGEVLGWVGGLPEYRGRVWELHPLLIRPDRRRQGLGRALVAAHEAEAKTRGGFTVTLGTDDDTGITSLANADLYADIPGHISGLHDLGHDHPFLFYRKVGFVVTGVLPDANGPGLPDIYMSKRIGG